MSAWKPDDKAWMKQRKAAWKAVKPKIDQLIFLNRQEKKVLKSYYLTGDEGKLIRLSGEEEQVLKEYFQIADEYECPSSEVTPPSVLQQMEAAPLLEMWLCPDQSEEAWRSLKIKYPRDRAWSDARLRFSEINWSLDSKYAPDGGSFFDGLEERMCRFFKFDTLKREDWPEWTDEEHMREARRGLEDVRGFDSYLRSDFQHPYMITRFTVPAWRDAMCVAYEGTYHGLEWLVESVCSILAAPAERSEIAVSMAKELRCVFDDPALPSAAREQLAEYMRQYGCL